MKPNIGMVNALLRLTCGFTMLAWSTARLAKRPYRERYFLVALLSAMKIGEGIVRFCPVTYLFTQYQEQQQQNNSQNQEDEFTSNPT
jgi:dipeptide/tripeptide permease